VRDICQVALMGDLHHPRTGMLPGHLVIDQSRKTGVPDAYETLWVLHVTGGHATIQFKSYDQKREAFQGTAKQGVWLDEEPPEDVATECAIRTMTTHGHMLLTFTPLQGLTPYVQTFLEDADLWVAPGLIVPAKDGFWQGKPAA
jgi:phage terminase large subunit-like protein